MTMPDDVSASSDQLSRRLDSYQWAFSWSASNFRFGYTRTFRGPLQVVRSTSESRRSTRNYPNSLGYLQTLRA
jgi:hypothetical protein